MFSNQIIKMAREAGSIDSEEVIEAVWNAFSAVEREAIIHIIETYRIPVGNSAAGEMACEWTYNALYEIRDHIRQRVEK